MGSENGASGTSARDDLAAREEVVMVQPAGESSPAGDSEHHTSMHLPHGTKQQEQEEEELKSVCLYLRMRGLPSRGPADLQPAPPNAGA